MSDHMFEFRGRGIGSGFQDEPYRYIRCDHGSVMVISHHCRGINFVLGYCRRVTMDRWGVYIHDPFRRVSNSSLIQSWPEPLDKGIFLYRPTRLEIIREEGWMRSVR